MFWGLVVTPGKVFRRTVDVGFLVQVATIDPSAPEGSRVSLCLRHQNADHILCTLTAGSLDSIVLGLEFTEGESIQFSIKGDHSVHLSGNTVEQYDDDDDDEDEEFDSEEEFSDEDGLFDMGESDEEEDDEEEGDYIVANAVEVNDEEAAAIEAAKRKAAPAEKENNKRKKEEPAKKKEKADVKKEKVETKKEKKAAAAAAAAATAASAAAAAAKTANATPSKKDTKAEAAKSAPVTPKTAEKPGKDNQKPKTPKSAKETRRFNIVVQDLAPGIGKEAKRGSRVVCHYRGTLASNGKQFDACVKGLDRPFQFTLGKGEVIKGWDIGIEGMKVGGVRQIFVPAAAGYGKRGSPPVIPSNANLNFTVELVQVK